MMGQTVFSKFTFGLHVSFARGIFMCCKNEAKDFVRSFENFRSINRPLFEQGQLFKCIESNENFNCLNYRLPFFLNFSDFNIFVL